MRGFVRAARRNPFINRIVRSILKSIKDRVSKLINYWPVSGKITVKISSVTIQLYSHADDALASKLYYTKSWEPHILEWFILFSKRSNVIIDAGANIGVFSLVASKVNEVAMIYAFEPNPYNIKRLRRNIAINDTMAQINVCEFAIGEKCGSIPFYLPDNRISDVSSAFLSHTKSFNEFEQSAYEVPLTSIDEFCSKNDVRPNLIKIDVELYELYVLKGMTSILKKDRPVIFCEIFNAAIKRKQTPDLQEELPENYTRQIEDLLGGLSYHFYSITSVGLLHVPNFQYSPMSSMYLLLPQILHKDFYLLSDWSSIIKEMDG